MADIDIRRDHGLGREGARAAAERLAAQLAQRFGLKGDWRGDVLHFERPGVTGALEVGAKHVHLTVALGFLLKAMKGSIESAAVREMDTLFAARPGPAGPKRST